MAGPVPLWTLPSRPSGTSGGSWHRVWLKLPAVCLPPSLLQGRWPTRSHHAEPLGQHLQDPLKCPLPEWMPQPHHRCITHPSIQWLKCLTAGTHGAQILTGTQHTAGSPSQRVQHPYRLKCVSPQCWKCWNASSTVLLGKHTIAWCATQGPFPGGLTPPPAPTVFSETMPSPLPSCACLASSRASSLRRDGLDAFPPQPQQLGSWAPVSAPARLGACHLLVGT